MSILKLAQTIELTMDIPESDKKIAANLIVNLQKFVKKLDSFTDHLDIMYDPFKKYNVISEESLYENRSAIWNYNKQILKNFEELKSLAFVCVKGLQFFHSDLNIKEMERSFVDSVSDIESNIENLGKKMQDYDVQDYKSSVNSVFENLKIKSSELKDLIEDRIIDNINKNILNKSWVDNIDDKDLDDVYKNNEPLISKLYKEREGIFNS
jgi:hypothetical protein